MSASMRAPMMWPQLVMKYWQAVRRAYSAANPRANETAASCPVIFAMTRNSDTSTKVSPR